MIFMYKKMDVHLVDETLKNRLIDSLYEGEKYRVLKDDGKIIYGQKLHMGYAIEIQTEDFSLLKHFIIIPIRIQLERLLRWLKEE